MNLGEWGAQVAKIRLVLVTPCSMHIALKSEKMVQFMEGRLKSTYFEIIFNGASQKMLILAFELFVQPPIHTMILLVLYYIF